MISTEALLAGPRGRCLRKPTGRHWPTSLAAMLSWKPA